jgi:hypothetical protein
VQPDRSNYEIWFIDWLDGKLSESRAEQLKAFLENNPDLGTELESLAFLKLKPVDSTYHGKEQLKKSVLNYSDSQFEYLCIAYLENDLLPEQEAELKEATEADNKKRKLFELFQKLRLNPPVYRFSRKAIVKKFTAGQKIIRFSTIGLTAAATVAILVMAYLFLPQDRGRKNNQAAVAFSQDTLTIGASVPIAANLQVQVPLVKDLRFSGIKTKPRNIIQGKQELIAEPEQETTQDSILRLHSYYMVSSLIVAYPSGMSLAETLSEDSLAPYNPEIMPPLYDPYHRRSNVDRFLARFFHEKIMRDSKAGDRPVDALELAKAGIEGLNKLLGWQMVLQENTDGAGAEKTYRFSSRLVKIKTPVKKISDIL